MIPHEKRHELSEYAELCNDELGELCLILNSVAQRTDYSLSEGFEKAIEAEIDAQLLNFKTYSKIVEREEEVVEKRIYEELEWTEA